MIWIKIPYFLFFCLSIADKAQERLSSTKKSLLRIKLTWRTLTRINKGTILLNCILGKIFLAIFITSHELHIFREFICKFLFYFGFKIFKHRSHIINLVFFWHRFGECTPWCNFIRQRANFNRSLWSTLWRI